MFHFKSLKHVGAEVWY